MALSDAQRCFGKMFFKPKSECVTELKTRRAITGMESMDSRLRWNDEHGNLACL
jgi:hypothetical protein